MDETLNPTEVKKELEKAIIKARKIIADAGVKYNRVAWLDPTDGEERYTVDMCKKRLMQIEFCLCIMKHE